MRGPILSGPLGSANSLEAIMRWLRGTGTAAVIGPPWLGEALAAEVPVLLLVEPEERPAARRAARRAAAAGKRLGVLVAGEELPLAPAGVGTLVVDGAADLDTAEAALWMAALIPALRPGGRLVAADATADVAVEARLSALFLQAALLEIVQERPRDGVLLTVGVAPPAPVVAARFGLST